MPPFVLSSVVKTNGHLKAGMEITRKMELHALSYADLTKLLSTPEGRQSIPLGRFSDTIADRVPFNSKQIDPIFFKMMEGSTAADAEQYLKAAIRLKVDNAIQSLSSPIMFYCLVHGVFEKGTKQQIEKLLKKTNVFDSTIKEAVVLAHEGRSTVLPSIGLLHAEADDPRTYGQYLLVAMKDHLPELNRLATDIVKRIKQKYFGIESRDFYISLVLSNILGYLMREGVTQPIKVILSKQSPSSYQLERLAMDSVDLETWGEPRPGVYELEDKSPYEFFYLFWEEWKKLAPNEYGVSLQKVAEASLERHASSLGFVDILFTRELGKLCSPQALDAACKSLEELCSEKELDLGYHIEVLGEIARPKPPKNEADSINKTRIRI